MALRWEEHVSQGDSGPGGREGLVHPKGLEEKVMLGSPKETANSRRISLTIPVGKTGQGRGVRMNTHLWFSRLRSTAWFEEQEPGLKNSGCREQ